MKKGPQKILVISLIIVFMLMISIISPSQLNNSEGNDISEQNRSPKPKSSKPIRVVLIGWDAVQRNHLYEILQDPNELPNLRQLIENGSFVETSITSGCTDTKAGWAQILTGYDPEKTGIYSNYEFQTIPEGYTIFERLINNFGNENIYTIMVTGKSDNIGSNEGFPYHNAIKHIDKNELNVEREADKVWSYAKDFLKDYIINHSMEHLFSFIHFREPDYIGHVSGEGHANYTRDIRTADQYTGEIFKLLKKNNLYNDTKIYLTTDHGFDESNAPFPVNPQNPGKQHRMAPYTFLASNDPKVIRNGDRKDVAPTILQQFGINLTKIKPRIDGIPLTSEIEINDQNNQNKEANDIKTVLLISWSGVQRDHLEEMLSQNNSLPNLKGLLKDGKYAKVASTHTQAFNMSYKWKIYGTDSTCGLATMLTGFDPDITSVYNNYRFGTIPEGYTVFETLKAHFSKNNITNIMVVGSDQENSDGEKIYKNAKKHIDEFHFNLPPDDVGRTMLKLMQNQSSSKCFSIIHFSYPDHAGHKFGENSMEYENAIKTCDQKLGIIIAKLIEMGIYNDTLIYITSTHGFDEQSAAFPIDEQNPGHNHSAAPYTFLITNDKSINIQLNQKDIFSIILNGFDIDWNTFNKPPFVKIRADSKSGYSPLKVSFSGGIDIDGVIVSHKWNFGDGNTSSQPNPVHVFKKKGIYNVSLIVMDNEGAKNEDFIIIKVDMIPIKAYIFVNKTIGKAPMKVSFFGIVKDISGELKNYSWILENQTISNEQNLSYEFLEPGNYEIKLFVYDEEGNKGETTLNLTILDPEQDSDNDFLPDWYELDFGFDPENPLDSLIDIDNDAYSNYIEFVIGTNPKDMNDNPTKYDKHNENDEVDQIQILYLIIGILVIVIFLMSIFLISQKRQLLKKRVRIQKRIKKV